MRLVVDTNVLISALLKATSVPALALEAGWASGVTLLVDARVLAEYREVLERPKFKKIPRERIEAILLQIASNATTLVDVLPYAGPLPDDDDRPFVEVALAGQADAVVTGNLKDFPEGLGFEVWPPATLLARLGY